MFMNMTLETSKGFLIFSSCEGHGFFGPDTVTSLSNYLRHCHTGRNRSEVILLSGYQDIIAMAELKPERNKGQKLSDTGCSGKPKVSNNLVCYVITVERLSTLSDSLKVWFWGHWQVNFCFARPCVGLCGYL